MHVVIHFQFNSCDNRLILVLLSGFKDLTFFCIDLKLFNKILNHTLRKFKNNFLIEYIGNDNEPI